MMIYSFVHQVFIECLLIAKAVLGAGDIMVHVGYHYSKLTVTRDHVKELVLYSSLSILRPTL